MPNSVTSAGITFSTQAELVTYFINALQQIFGSQINLFSDTPDGQLVNLIIQLILDQQDWTMQGTSSFDPDLAIGVLLDQRVAINGIQRQGGTYTTVYVNVTSSSSVNLYGLDQTVQPVYTLSDNVGNQWQLIATQLGIGPTVSSLLFQASVPGATIPTPNSITTQVTVVLGVTQVNNPASYATLGINEESDVALKLRRSESTSIPSTGFYQGLRAALLNINGITTALVHENDSSGTDTFSTPGHSIWVIVGGTVSLPLSVAWNSTTTYQYGNIASYSGVNYISVQNNNTGNTPSGVSTFWSIYNPIAQAIYAYRNAGCGMKGATSYNIVQYDGTAFPVYWDTVSSENLFIKFNVVSLNAINYCVQNSLSSIIANPPIVTPPNMSAIILALESIVYSPYQEATTNQVASVVFAADSNTFASSFGLSASSGGSFTNTLLPTSLNYQFIPVPIVLPIMLSCPSGSAVMNASGVVTTVNVTVANSGTIQFAPLGGYGVALSTPYVVSGSGTVTTGGLYTAPSSGSGTDTLTFTDSLGNTATATITY